MQVKEDFYVRFLATQFLSVSLLAAADCPPINVQSVSSWRARYTEARVKRQRRVVCATDFFFLYNSELHSRWPLR